MSLNSHVHRIVIRRSATPGAYELDRVPKADTVAEQIIRPTGSAWILKMEVSSGRWVKWMTLLVKSTLGLMLANVPFITTLTKKMAEDLTDYLKDMGVKVQLLALSDIKTLERTADYS